MIAYIIRRILHGFVVLVVLSLLIFLAVRFLPGDPIMLFIDEMELGQLSEEKVDALREEYGLNRPILIQYLAWIADLLKGDLGRSVHYEEDVGKLLAERFPVTIYLGSLAIVLSSFFGMLAGVISAIRWGKWQDTVLTAFANIGITVPIFWLGILLIYLFGFRLQWLPLSGFTSPFEDLWLSLRQVILPVICLSIFSLASITRQARSSTLEVIRQDYIRTAMSKGLKERTIILRHTLKNAFIPVVTLMGTRVRIVFGGTVLIETVFNIPGVGRLMASAVFGRDFPVVQAGVLCIAAIVILTNLIVDISYGWLDPRIRYD